MIPTTDFPATDLHVYLIENGADRWWYAAKSAEDALSKWCPDWDKDYTPQITSLSDDYRLTIHGLSDPDGENGSDYDEEKDIQTKTCREWCVYFGEGMVCSNMEF